MQSVVSNNTNIPANGPEVQMNILTEHDEKFDIVLGLWQTKLVHMGPKEGDTQHHGWPCQVSQFETPTTEIDRQESIIVLMIPVHGTNEGALFRKCQSNMNCYNLSWIYRKSHSYH